MEGLICSPRTVGRLQLSANSLIQFGCIGLDPAPDAAAIDVKTSLGQQFGDVLVSERISQIPTHCEQNHFARILTTFERIPDRDRHGFPRYQIRSSGSSQQNPRMSITSPS